MQCDIPTRPEDVILALREFAPRRRWSRIAASAKILHDLLITGDEFHSMMFRLDPQRKIDFLSLLLISSSHRSCRGTLFGLLCWDASMPKHQLQGSTNRLL
jgi:hypothetical protein